VRRRFDNGVAILAWRGDFYAERATVELRDSDGGLLTAEQLVSRRR
jgi:hypothetical protein